MTKRALLVVYSDLSRDSRVQRHLLFLKEAGYHVDVWDHSLLFQRYNRSFRDKALFYFYLLFHPFKAYEMIFRTNSLPEEKEYDLVIANDWNALPLAFRAPLSKQGVVIYDSHELALHQNRGSFKWRLTFPRIIRAVEKKYISRADHVITVNEDIAGILKKIYKIPRCGVVRNIPFQRKTGPGAGRRGAGEEVRLYHHGGYIPRRRLEVILEAVLKVNRPLSCYLRIDPAGAALLKKRFTEGNRFHYLDMVSPEHLFSLEESYDLGVAAIAPVNLNHVYSLSNKFFEYLFMGLPVLVTQENRTMARYVKEYGIGFVAESFTSQSFIKLLSRLSLAEIEQKRSGVISFLKNLDERSDYKRLMDEIRKREA